LISSAKLLLDFGFEECFCLNNSSSHFGTIVSLINYFFPAKKAVMAVPIAEQIAAASNQRSFSVMGVSVFGDCCVSICDQF